MKYFNNINPAALTRLGQPGSIFSKGSVLMKENGEKVKLITADYGQPSGMFKFKKEFPDDFINVGIAEQNLIGISAGITQEGYTAIAGAQACFVSMRSFEQVRQYMGYMEIPIILVGVSSGFALTFFGNTHYALEDYGLISSIPNLLVFSPSDGLASLKALSTAVKLEKPSYIRTTGTQIQPKIYSEYQELDDEYNTLFDGQDFLILSSGSVTRNCIDAVKTLHELGYSARLIDVMRIHPIPESLLTMVSNYDNIFVVEEHYSMNSFASRLRAQTLKNINQINIKDCFQNKIGDYDFMLKQNRLDSLSIKETILQTL